MNRYFRGIVFFTSVLLSGQALTEPYHGDSSIKTKNFSYRLKKFLKAHGREIAAGLTGATLGVLGTGLAMKTWQNNKIDALNSAHDESKSQLIQKYEADKEVVAAEREKARLAREATFVTMQSFLKDTYQKNVDKVILDFQQWRKALLVSVDEQLKAGANLQQVTLEKGVDTFNQSGSKMLSESQQLLQKSLVQQQKDLAEIKSQFKAQEERLIVESKRDVALFEKEYARLMQQQAENNAQLLESVVGMGAEQKEALISSLDEKMTELSEAFKAQRQTLLEQLAADQFALQKAQEAKAAAFVHDALGEMKEVAQSALQLHSNTAQLAHAATHAAYGAANYASHAAHAAQHMSMQQQQQYMSQQVIPQQVFVQSQSAQPKPSKSLALPPAPIEAKSSFQPAEPSQAAKELAAIKMQALFRGSRVRKAPSQPQLALMDGSPSTVLSTMPQSKKVALSESTPLLLTNKPWAEIEKERAERSLAAAEKLARQELLKNPRNFHVIVDKPQSSVRRPIPQLQSGMDTYHSILERPPYSVMSSSSALMAG